jgi:predicted nucleic acid-binding protein
MPSGPQGRIATLLAEGILPYVRLRAITADEVLVVQKRAGEQGLSGGIIYDLYHLAVAEKEGVDRFYTFNTRHFQSLATSVMLDRIITP